MLSSVSSPKRPPPATALLALDDDDNNNDAMRSDGAVAAGVGAPNKTGPPPLLSSPNKGLLLSLDMMFMVLRQYICRYVCMPNKKQSKTAKTKLIAGNKTNNDDERGEDDPNNDDNTQKIDCKMVTPLLLNRVEAVGWMFRISG